ncbi:TonB family protein [Halioxenophilus sp. WMMB6]|uniref:TonB family protein n=1 Tax=Halioxenophilus sp. WMMB6 TaxID=3073815 RepID=UPI00295E6A73|nr:TonB family protein [Halioxenophilus sp. WMMB6]
MFGINITLLRHLRGALYLFGICCISQVNAEPLLNGLASYQQLGNERFIAALYLDKLTSDSKGALAVSQHRQMELRIPDSFSARRHIRTWIEGAAINNPAALLTEQAEAMVAFTELINIPLKSGDHLLIDAPWEGAPLVISLNGTELGTISQAGLFDVLLRAWIGNVPLSSTFRQEILADGKVDPDLRARFTQLTPTPERVAYAKTLTQKSGQDSEQATTVAAATTSKRAPNPAPAAAAPATVVAVHKPAIQPPSTKVHQPPAAPPQQAANVAETSVTVASVEPISQPPVDKPAPRASSESTAQKNPITLASLGDERLIDDDDDVLSEPLSVNDLLQQQLYHSELLSWAYGKVRYPKRAVDRNHEGRVTLQVTINQKGKVVETETLDGSGYSTLDSAAIRAVKDADPFPAPPMELNGQLYSFTVPIEFRLQ